MISNIDKTESERLNQKLRDIVTGKYQSPAKQRNNFSVQILIMYRTKTVI